MRALITGASGLLGWNLLRTAPEDWQILATVHRNLHLPQHARQLASTVLDITDRHQVDQVIGGFAPDVTVHLSSVGNLDFCQNNPAEAWRVNVEGTRNVLDATSHSRGAVVFASTIYVFDGSCPPYAEGAEANPLNEYGRTKLAAEQLVAAYPHRSVILRPMTTYGWHHPSQRMNWVTWLVRQLERGEHIRVVNDVFNNHLWVDDGTRAIIESVRRDVSGPIHLGGPDCVSRYDFSIQIADVFGFPDALLSPVSSASFSGLAQRPANAACTIDRMRDVLGLEPAGIRKGLEAMRCSHDAFISSMESVLPESSLQSPAGNELRRAAARE